jgi:hypothetical protein
VRPIHWPIHGHEAGTALGNFRLWRRLLRGLRSRQRCKCRGGKREDRNVQEPTKASHDFIPSLIARHAPYNEKM